VSSVLPDSFMRPPSRQERAGTFSPAAVDPRGGSPRNLSGPLPRLEGLPPPLLLTDACFSHIAPFFPVVSTSRCPVL
jgi:hypothetical protein